MKAPGLLTETAAELVGALVPGSAPALKTLAGKVREEWRVRNAIATHAAITCTGLSAEEFAQQVLESPQLLPLASRVLWQATVNGQDHVLEAMGAVLGAAAAGRATADAAEMVLRGLESLHGDDGLALAVILRRPLAETADDDTGGLASEGVVAIDTALTEQELNGWTASRLRAALRRLEQGGFIEQWLDTEPPIFEATPLGRVLVEALSRLNTAT